MRRLTNPKIHIKQCFFVFLLILTVLGTVGGCNDGSGGNNDQALTENDFVNDDSLRANPEGGVIVTFLEHPIANNQIIPPPDKPCHVPDRPEVATRDTSCIGKDEIPLKYKRTLEHTFCWEDEDEEAGHFMQLLDSEGSEILRVDVNSECVTEVIEKGNYVMAIYHDGRTETTHPIFMIPNPQDLEQARRTEGLINKLKVVGVNILKGVHNTVTADAEAQTVEDNIQTLLSTNSCVMCDLSDAELQQADLSGAELQQADLSRAGLQEAILSNAELSFAILYNATLADANLRDAILRGAIMRFALLDQADLEGANLRNANLSNADLSGANLRDADLSNADLSNACLVGAGLFNADFSFAILINAILDDAILSNADFSFATWCDGCQCTDPSIGTCNGCPSVEEVCTFL